MSEEDVRWWTGLDAASIREALASLGDEILPVQVDALGGRFLLHRDDDQAIARLSPKKARPEVSLLPILDPYLQGYKNRERVIDQEHRDYVSDGKGNTTSVLLADGRVAGIWDLVREPEPELRIFFLAAPPRAVREQALAAAATLGTFLLEGRVPVIEVEAMTPLTERPGWVLSPLKAAGSRRPAAAMENEELAVDRAIYLVDRENRTYRYGRRNPDWRQLSAAENERNKHSLNGYTRLFPDGRTKVFCWPPRRRA